MKSQLQTVDRLTREWKNKEKPKTTDLEILEIIPEEKWEDPSELYAKYSHRNKDTVTKPTFSKYLKALERQGKVEARGKTNSRQYRRADKPVQEVRENYSSPLSEGLPDFLERRIENEIEQRVDEKIDELLDKIEQERQRSQDSHNQELRKAVAQAENGEMSEIMEVYRENVEDPLSGRSVRRRLNKLRDRGEIRKTGRRSSTRYHVD